MKTLITVEIRHPDLADGEDARDRVKYNSDGRIAIWEVWSDYFSDWMETSVLTIKASFPSSFERALAQVDADREYRKYAIAEAKADEQVDQSRDEKAAI